MAYRFPEERSFKVDTKNTIPTPGANRMSCFVGAGNPFKKTTEAIVRGTGILDSLAYQALSIVSVGANPGASDYQINVDYQLYNGDVKWGILVNKSVAAENSTVIGSLSFQTTKTLLTSVSAVYNYTAIKNNEAVTAGQTSFTLSKGNVSNFLGNSVGQFGDSSLLFNNPTVFAIEIGWTATLTTAGQYKVNYATGQVQTYTATGTGTLASYFYKETYSVTSATLSTLGVITLNAAQNTGKYVPLTGNTMAITYNYNQAGRQPDLASTYYVTYNRGRLASEYVPSVFYSGDQDLFVSDQDVPVIALDSSSNPYLVNDNRLSLAGQLAFGNYTYGFYTMQAKSSSVTDMTAAINACLDIDFDDLIVLDDNPDFLRTAKLMISQRNSANRKKESMLHGATTLNAIIGAPGQAGSILDTAAMLQANYTTLVTSVKQTNRMFTYLLTSTGVGYKTYVPMYYAVAALIGGGLSALPNPSDDLMNVNIVGLDFETNDAEWNETQMLQIGGNNNYFCGAMLLWKENGNIKVRDSVTTTRVADDDREINVQTQRLYLNRRYLRPLEAAKLRGQIKIKRVVENGVVIDLTAPKIVNFINDALENASSPLNGYIAGFDPSATSATVDPNDRTKYIIKYTFFDFFTLKRIDNYWSADIA